MSIWAVVPSKSFARAKSRLAGLLSGEARAALSRDLLVRTLEVLAQAPAIAGTVVVSRDPRALELARRSGAVALQEEGPAELNAAVTAGAQAVAGQGAEAVLVLPADLPLVAVEDVQVLATLGADAQVVVAPDRRRTGTNALLVRPPGLLRFAFGENSFQRHRALARRAGARLSVCRRPFLAFDVDLPEDLLLLQLAQEVDHGK